MPKFGQRKPHRASAEIREITGPPLLGAPTASSPNNGKPGDDACTQIAVSQNLTVHSSSTGSNFFDVAAAAVNFGGQSTWTTWIRVKSSP